MIRPAAPPATEVVRFPVRGMTCNSCVIEIMRAIGKVPGVTKVSVSLRHETATVRREQGRATADELAAAVAATGYEPDLAAAEILQAGTDRTWLDRLLRRS